jgi:X-linked retinitis pigmentosa GTPase regulator
VERGEGTERGHGERARREGREGREERRRGGEEERRRGGEEERRRGGEEEEGRIKLVHFRVHFFGYIFQYNFLNDVSPFVVYIDHFRWIKRM